MANSTNSNGSTEIPTPEEVIANGKIIFQESRCQEMYLLEVDTFGKEGEFDCWLARVGEKTVIASYQEALVQCSWWYKKDFSEEEFQTIKYGGASARWIYDNSQKLNVDDDFWKSKPRNYVQIAEGYIVANTFYISHCSIGGKESRRWVRKSISCKLTKKNTPSKVNSEFAKEVNKYELELATSAWKIAGYVQPFIYIVVGSGYVDTNIEKQHE